MKENAIASMQKSQREKVARKYPPDQLMLQKTPSYKKTSPANKQPPGLINFTPPILSNPKPGGSARLRPGPALDRPAVALAQLSTAGISFNIRLRISIEP